MSQPVLVGIDGGTEGLRVGIYDLKGQECAFHSAAYPTHFPQPGRAEQEPDDWWGALCQALPQALRKAGVSGADWRVLQSLSLSDAKQQLFELVNAELAAPRDSYEALINDPAKIERELQRGAERARDVAAPFIGTLREAVGIRALG